MKRKINCIKITKKGLDKINLLLNSFIVNNYHKTLLKGIKSRSEKKNLSKADCDIFETISKQYNI